MDLNPSQRAAVESEAALTIVLAGPGSGKTRALTARIRRLSGSSVMAVMTFTNAAAYEIRSRLSDVEIGYCGTLHGWCFRLLQQFGAQIGYKAGSIAIMPEAEKIPRLLAVRDALGIKLSQQKIMSVQTLTPITDERERKAHAELWREYRFLLKRNNLVDYDGILRDACHLIGNANVRREIHIDDLLVEEAQDSGPLDWLIYDKIPAANKFFVGDYDQSIYAFRGALPSGLLELAKLPEATVFRLEENYRSDVIICAAANNLIEKNPNRIAKQIKPVSAEPGELHVKTFDDGWMEAEWLASEIRKLLRAGDSIAVLYRMNSDATALRRFLAGQDLPVAQASYEVRPPDWERALLLLSLMLSPDNEILIERYLLIDHSPEQVKRWKLEATAKGKGLQQRAANMIGVALDAYVSGKATLPTYLRANGVSEETERLIKQRSDLLSADATIADLLHDLYAHEDTRRQSNVEGAYVGTIHSAKGREWDCVFLPAFEQGNIPHRKETNIEEERRLAFVAMTRAREKLYVSSASARKHQWSSETDIKPSQFIEEMCRGSEQVTLIV